MAQQAQISALSDKRCLQGMYYLFLEGLLAQNLITGNSKTESVSKLKYWIYSFGMMVYHSKFLEEDLRTHESHPPLIWYILTGRDS